MAQPNEVSGARCQKRRCQVPGTRCWRKPPGPSPQNPEPMEVPMSLVKKPEMTEKKVAANRRNQKLCNGPVIGRAPRAHPRRPPAFWLQRAGGGGGDARPGRRSGRLPGTAGSALGGMESRRRLAGGRGDRSGAGPVADESRRPHAGRLRRAPGPGSEQRAAGPAARADDAPEDDGGKIKAARRIGGARALRHHAGKTWRR